MIKIFKDSLKISYSNIIMATPLLVFLLLLNVYLVIAKNAVKALPSTILFCITLLLMVSAFLAGWFYMIKSAVGAYNNSTEADSEYTGLLKEFLVGIALNIKSFLGFCLLYLLIADIVFISVYNVGLKLIGSIGISVTQFVSATEAPVAMQALLESLTKEQLLKINYWYLLIFLAVQIFSLFTMFWPVEILYSAKNPILALFKSVFRVFMHPKVILLFLGINLLNFVLMIFNYITMFNPITYFVMTLVYFYFIVYIFVLLFLYYEEKIKGNSNSVTDRDRQD